MLLHQISQASRMEASLTQEMVAPCKEAAHAAAGIVQQVVGPRQGQRQPH